MKRSWLQLQLSTLLILSFAASVLLWANLHAVHVDTGDGFDLANCGFPYPIKEFRYFVIDCMFDPNETLKDSTYYLPWNIAKNVGVGMAILAVVATVCEMRVRRRTRNG